MRTVPRTIALILAVLLVAAVGSFGGQWLWNWWTLRAAAQLQAAAQAAVQAEKASPMGIQRAVVMAHMNDPESVQFRNDAAAKRVPGVWCGEVNARNRMGGMVGFTRYVAEMDSQRVSFDDGGNGFAGKWRAYCE